MFVDNPSNSAPNVKKKSNDASMASEVAALEAKIANLEKQLQAAQESERRSLADYQNLVRRQREERVALGLYATREVVTTLLEPLQHLRLAEQQLNDPGLSMVCGQLWKQLEQLGLVEFSPVGELFDVESMEVAEQQGEGETVIKVLRSGFKLHNEVIQHARVVVGSPEKTTTSRQ